MKTMKTSLAIIIAAFAINMAQAANYLTDFEAAKKKAKAEKKALLVKFTGSDWCRPCQTLDKNVFSKAAFKKSVAENYVVVVIDFPRKKKLPEAQAKANKALAKKYKVRGYPTVLLMNEKGKIFKNMGSYRGEDHKAYLKKLQSSAKAKAFR